MSSACIVHDCRKFDINFLQSPNSPTYSQSVFLTVPVQRILLIALIVNIYAERLRTARTAGRGG